MTTHAHRDNIFLKLHPLHRILVGFVSAAIVFVILWSKQVAPLLLSMVLWDVFSLSYLITCWVVIAKRPTHQIRNVARQQDGSRLFVFMVVLISSFASMLTVLLLIVSKKTTAVQEMYYLPVTLLGMLLSWIMVHTTFTFHYAHLFYNDQANDRKNHAEGLEFPGEKMPDYLDFAYFAFVVGMTFQVSDVQVTSRTLRRLVLLHGLLSFGLNTFVVALTINVIAGLQN